MYYVFFQVDVIVNSSNMELELCRGALSLSIVEKGGRSIVDECRERFRNGIDFGEVVCTKAGRMNFKFICHGALPDWTPTAKYSIKVCISHRNKTFSLILGLGLLWLTPLSTIIQSYHGGQFYWWRKLEYLEKTTDVPQVTDKLYHTMLYRVNHRLSVIQTHKVWRLRQWEL